VKRTHFRVNRLETTVLLHNIFHCEDADNDADRTMEELVSSLEYNRGYVEKSVLESALYCCNMNNEQGKYWHPFRQPIKMFIKTLLGSGFTFDYYYHLINEVEDADNKEAT